MNLYIPSKEDIREIVKDELAVFQPIKYPEPDDYLTKDDVGNLLKLGHTAIDNLRRKGHLKPYYIGGSVRFLRSQVLEMVKEMNK